MGKEEILDYVMNSPGNTNRAVLSGMLDSVTGGSGGETLIVNDVGGTSDKTWQEIYDAMPNVVIIIPADPNLQYSSDSKELIVHVYAVKENGVPYEYNFQTGYGDSYMCTTPDDYPVKQ